MNEHEAATIIPLDDDSQIQISADLALDTVDLVTVKMADSHTPGYQAEFDPDEAEFAGAFKEDALSEADAMDSIHDTPHVAAIAFWPAA